MQYLEAGVPGLSGQGPQDGMPRGGPRGLKSGRTRDGMIRRSPEGCEKRMRLRKLVALLLILSICFAAGVMTEARYTVWQPLKLAGEGYLAAAKAGLPGWLNPENLAAVAAGGLLLTVIMRAAKRLRTPGRTEAGPSLRERVGARRAVSNRARARG